MVPFPRRWVMWAAVRWAAAKKGGFTADWWIELPRALLVTLLVLPIVAPAAIVIMIALVGLYILELITWLILQLGKVIGRRIRLERPDKRVVTPELSLRL
jgi:hypothetical protein